MTDEIMTDEKTYQVFISGISWNKDSAVNYRSKFSRNASDLPGQFTLDIPINVIMQAKKHADEFNDIVETFVYNFLTHKFGYEVYSCAIWLPLENN